MTYGYDDISLVPSYSVLESRSESNPKMYDYCMNELGIKKVLEYCKIPYEWRDLPEQNKINFELEE